MRNRSLMPVGQRLGLLLVVLLLISRCRADVNKTVVEAGKRATALVEIGGGRGQKGWATAFCIDKTGVFVTNSHVAKTGAEDNKLTLVIDSGLRTQRSLTATVLKVDPEQDLAILRADPAAPYASLALSDPTAIRALVETTPVTVFGYPFGNALAMRNDVLPEASIISSRIMALRHDKGELQLIQLDGSINPGNSGGPVIDERGKVVGIIASGIPGSAISFAIPADRVRRLLVLAHVVLTSRSPTDATAGFLDLMANDDSQAADPAGRTSVPTEAARTEVRPLIHDLLAKEFADATPKGKRALAAALFARGAATADDPVGCYELLSESIDAAVESANLDTAVEACAEIARRYDINTPAQKAATLIRIAPKLTSSWDSALLAGHALLTAQALLHRDGYATAQQLVPIIRTAAIASYSPLVQKEVRDRLAVINAACAQYALAYPAITKLTTAPNDPGANLTVGRFECFTRNDFAKGLPRLAKGSDAALKAAAIADLAGASTGATCKAVGDAWWNQAAKETTDAGAAAQCKARAGYWYRQGVDQLEGLAKALVQQRLATIPLPAAGDALPEATVTAAPVDGGAFPPPHVGAPVVSPHTVNLLVKNAVATSVIEGSWDIGANAITCQPKPHSRIEFLYAPPIEYDFRVTFRRLAGNDSISLVAVGNEHQFIWGVAGYSNKVCGFSIFDGRNIDTSPASKRASAWLTNGQQYTSVVKVRKNRVDGFLNGKIICSLDSDYSNATLANEDKLHHPNTLGVIVWDSNVRITQADVVEISGAGKFVEAR